MEERLIAAAIKSRKVLGLIPIDFEFTEVGQTILDMVEDYYEVDKDTPNCEIDVLKSRVKDYFKDDVVPAWTFLDALPKVESLSIPNIEKDLLTHKKERLRQEIRSCALAGSDDELLASLERFRNFDFQNNKGEERVLKSVKVSDLIKQHFSEEGSIKLWPKKLHDLTGPARRGHTMLVYARPEIGKTLFVINLVAGFLKQGLRVLYVGNEDPDSDILLRQICRLTKRSKQQVASAPDEAEALAREVGYDNLVNASLTPGNFKQIRRITEQESPDVVVLDQLRNLDVGCDSLVQGLEKAATEARNLAKRYNLLCVSVTQAGDSASGKAVLDISDVDSSKTGAPAQFDLMVGIGADSQMEKTGYRTANLSKNKLSGVHSSFTFNVDFSTGVILNA